jgi:hypothetical protein
MHEILCNVTGRLRPSKTARTEEPLWPNPTMTPAWCLNLRQRSIPSAESLNLDPSLTSVFPELSFMAARPIGSNFPARPLSGLLTN